MISRRQFMANAAIAGGCAALNLNGASTAETTNTRRYHVCLSSRIFADNPALIDVVSQAGVTDIWQAAFLYGHWYDSIENLRAAREFVESKGLRWHLINVPLGHPGDALGDTFDGTPTAPPTRWQMAVSPDGSKYSGTSLHPPGTQENVEAIKALAPLKPDCIFLDDDFRLARGPGVIGGCFCDWHKKRFLDKHGYAEARWGELLGDVQARSLSDVLRAWVDFTCDELTASFRAQQAAAPEIEIGNMIMYFGAEKAGIRLADYADTPFRVGEMMFSDSWFNKLKCKTDELFSALFHRRYAKPDLAYSESTAYPADQLSATNMAAKLVVSTITDVRNTMYMSGLTPFPETHWDVLAPAMRKQADHHEILKGHKPQGPFKHYWGEASRYVGDDNPYSLFLATGIPFEVVDELPNEGWAFLSDHDAQNLTKAPDKLTLVSRKKTDNASGNLRVLNESMEDLWTLKREVVAAGLDAPYILDDKPVVCAWYPTANAVLLWNLTEQKESLRLHWKGKTTSHNVGALDTTLISLT